MSARGISEETLHALVDKRLPAADATVLERRICSDVELFDTIALWRRQSAALATAFAPVIDEPLPPKFLGAASDRTSGLRLFWVILGFIFGVMTGIPAGLWLATGAFP